MLSRNKNLIRFIAKKVVNGLDIQLREEVLPVG